MLFTVSATFSGLNISPFLEAQVVFFGVLLFSFDFKADEEPAEALDAEKVVHVIVVVVVVPFVSLLAAVDPLTALASSVKILILD
jgi:hypothetical protein